MLSIKAVGNSIRRALVSTARGNYYRSRSRGTLAHGKGVLGSEDLLIVEVGECHTSDYALILFLSPAIVLGTYLEKFLRLLSLEYLNLRRSQRGGNLLRYAYRQAIGSLLYPLSFQ